jgi:hypothetical protein
MEFECSVDKLSDSPAEALRRLMKGARISQAIYVAAKLGIPDLLARARAPPTSSLKPRTRMRLRSLGFFGSSRRSAFSLRRNRASSLSLRSANISGPGHGVIFGLSRSSRAR